MTEAEVNEFIKTMAEYDDIWTKDQVICTYGERSFEDALANRKKEIEIMLSLIHI